MVVFLTGVGTRFLTQVIETKYSHAAWVEALSRIIIVARGPKPVAALFELGVPIHVRAPEPNTWVELLIALDEAKEQFALAGCRIAVQEYGISNRELIQGLEARGAVVQPVPVYQWALPLDIAPLREAIAAMIMDQIQVLLFTTSVQVIHVMRIAAEMGLETILRQAMSRMIIASIGPTTSEALANYGLKADIEPSHPKMGILVKETAEGSLELLVRKKMRASQYST